MTSNSFINRDFCVISYIISYIPAIEMENPMLRVTCVIFLSNPFIINLPITNPLITNLPIII